MVAFLFTGQGSEYPAMTAGLYRESPAYRRHFDAADAALAAHLGHSVREAVLGEAAAAREGGARAGAGVEGGRPELVQPALFAVGYALARTLVDLGVTPAAVLGHSLGEYAAAVTAGVLTLDEAAGLVVRRARLTAALPSGGGMTSVAAGADELAAVLAAEPEVVVAALNGPADTVLSGPLDALARIGEELAGLGIRTRPLASPYAFHSAQLAPVAAGLRAAPVHCGPAALPVASTRYGRMLRDEPMDAGYWAGQTEEPVLFDAALGALVHDIAPTHLVEIGPRPQLTRIAARAGSLGGAELLHPAPGPEGTGRDLAETVAALYRCGLDPVWEELYAPEHRVPEPLAPYVFSSAQRYWDRPPASVEPRVERRPDMPAVSRETPMSEVSRETPNGETGDDDPVLVAVVEAVTEVGGYPTERVVREARFHEDLGFDSVMIMQLKNRVEARLPRVGEVSVQQMLPALRSVGSLAEFLDGVIMARSA